MVVRKKSGLRQITPLYMVRHIERGEVRNICSDTRCESGEDGGQKTFKIGDWIYSHGNNSTRRLFCPTCSCHQNLISKAQLANCMRAQNVSKR